MRTRIAQFYSPRRLLVRLHMDLLEIELRVRSDSRPEPLDTLETFVLILEDRRFFRHAGFDIASCLRELVRLVTFRRFGGASTIDMQFVRTVTGFRQRTLRRKLYEMLLAWIIQFRYNKFEILRSYLHCAYFGSGIYGCEVAARKIYHKPSSELSESEAAELAAMLVYPRPLQPTSGWKIRVSRRADYAKRLFPRLKQRFEKLPSAELV